MKGSADVPSPQIFPVSCGPCSHHRSGLSMAYTVCLIWLEFPPPPTWHSPHSLEHSGPRVLTSTPTAGLPAPLEHQEEGHGKPAANPTWKGARTCQPFGRSPREPPCLVPRPTAGAQNQQEKTRSHGSLEPGPSQISEHSRPTTMKPGERGRHRKGQKSCQRSSKHPFKQAQADDNRSLRYC